MFRVFKVALLEAYFTFHVSEKCQIGCKTCTSMVDNGVPIYKILLVYNNEEINTKISIIQY